MAQGPRLPCTGPRPGPGDPLWKVGLQWGAGPFQSEARSLVAFASQREVWQGSPRPQRGVRTSAFCQLYPRPTELGPGLAHRGGAAAEPALPPRTTPPPENTSPGSKAEARVWRLPTAGWVGRPQGGPRALLRGGGPAVKRPRAVGHSGRGRGSRPLTAPSPPLPLAPAPAPPRPRPPSLQLLDAHHEAEVALRVLLDDIPHVVGLPSLLRPGDSGHPPRCAPLPRHSPEGWAPRAAGPSRPLVPLLAQLGELAQPGARGGETTVCPLGGHSGGRPPPAWASS